MVRWGFRDIGSTDSRLRGPRGGNSRGGEGEGV